LLCFACIDLTTSPKKPSACALLGVRLEIELLKSFNTDSEIIAAYTAYLHHQGRTELIGDPDEGLIPIPSTT